MLFNRGDMKSFGEVLTEYANNLNGFDWYFSYDYNERAFRFKRRMHLLTTPPALLPKGSPDPPYDEEHRPGIDTYVFDYPGNITSLELVEDGDNACTRQFVAGGYPGAQSGVIVTKPIGSWNNMEYIDAGYPLVENVEASAHSTTHKIDHLNSLATVYGRDAAPPVRQWTITVNGSMDPIVGTYRVGHWCRIIVNDNFVMQSLSTDPTWSPTSGVVKRIVGYTVNVPTGPQFPESVTLELEDEPTISYDLTSEGRPDDERGTFVYGTYMPDGTSTGVPDNEDLTAYNQASVDTITLKSGDIIEDKIIYGDIKVPSGVTNTIILRRCRLVGGSHSPSALTAVVDATNTGTADVSIKLVDCEIVPRVPDKNRDGIIGKRFQSIRNDIQSVPHGIRLAPGSQTDLNVEVKGSWIHLLLLVDGRTTHCVRQLGGRNVLMKGNRFGGGALPLEGQYTPPVGGDIRDQQGTSDEAVYITGTGYDETVVYNSNFVSGGSGGQVRVFASVEELEWSNNKHFRLTAEDETHLGYWIRIEDGATTVHGLNTNIWQSGNYRGTIMQEPRDLGIHFDS
jgi:hypothetical protein